MKSQNKRIRKIDSKLQEQCMLANLSIDTPNKILKVTSINQGATGEAWDTSDSEVQSPKNKTSCLSKNLDLSNPKFAKSQCVKRENKIEDEFVKK